jgi:Cellulose biosynthesis GIL
MTSGEVRGAKTGVSLGVPGLADRFNRLSPGLFYLLAFDQQPLRLSILARAALSAIRAGKPCALVTSQDPRVLLRKLALLGSELDGFVNQGLTVLRVPRIESTGELPGFLRSLAQEIRQIKLASGALVILDHVEDRVGLEQPPQAAAAVRQWQEWIEQNGHTLLATVMTDARMPALEATLRALSEQLGGLAIQRSIRGEITLEVHHWFGATGALPRTLFDLAFGESGQLRARPTAPVQSRAPDPSSERQVVAERAADGFRGTDWMVLGSILHVLDRARTLEAGTLVLHFERSSAFRELCQAVAIIRGLGNPRLRVIVRECGARLRLQQTVALLRLGASLVIPREVPGLSARLMAQSLQGTTFNRPYAKDVDEVLGDSAAETGGLLPVEAFRVRAQKHGAIVSESGVPVTLVRFSPASPQVLRAVLAALQQGARDCLYTAQAGCIWLLLVGCAAADAPRVLMRLMGPRYESLVGEQLVTDDPARVLQTLRLLDKVVTDPADGVFADTLPL